MIVNLRVCPWLAVIVIMFQCITATAAPFADQTLDANQARAILNRWGYGATPSCLQKTIGMSPRAYLQRAIQDESALPAEVTRKINNLPSAEPLDSVWSRLGPGGTTDRAKNKKEIQRETRQFAVATAQARLLTMAGSDNQGREALLSFWLNHFSIHALKGQTRLLAADYVRAINAAIKQDSFEALLRASFFHPAMLVYLDNVNSSAPNSTLPKAKKPRKQQKGLNENLARELLELHTLGVGSGYEQSDVQALARIITGAGLRRADMDDKTIARSGAVAQGKFLFDPRRHDFGEKQLLGQRFPAGQGLAEIDRALHLLARHPATAKRVAFKLAQRFLTDEPPAALVTEMSNEFLRSSGKISATLMPLLNAKEFASSLSKPSKFKEPLDFILSAARAACANTPITNAELLYSKLNDLDQVPLMNSTPDGFGATQADWFSPDALAKRVRFTASIGTQPLQSMGKESRMHGKPCDADIALVMQATGPASAAVKDAGANLSPSQRIALLLSTPEFMKR